MKRKIAWLLGLLICLVILCVLFFLLDKPRINGFIQAKNRSIVYVHTPPSLIEMGIVENSIRFTPFVSFLNASFRIGDKIYCGYQNNIRVYDANYQFVKEFDIHTLGVPENISLHTPVKIESGSMWWAAGKGVYGENPYFPPHLIIHITLSGESLRADYYEIGEFAAAAVQKDGNNIFVFRKGQPYYEIYDTTSRSVTSKIIVEGYKLDHIGSVFYDEPSGDIIVYGDSNSDLMTVIGYIKDQKFTQIYSSKENITGLFADGTLFYYFGNRLYRYSPKFDTPDFVFAPQRFCTNFYCNYAYDQDENVLIYFYSYHDLLGRIHMNTLFLNLKTKQYYLDESMPPLSRL